MTHLSITEDPGEEFVFRGINTITGLREDGVIFYADVTKVHVVPEPIFPMPYCDRPDVLAASTSAPVKRSTSLSSTNKLIASFNSC